MHSGLVFPDLNTDHMLLLLSSAPVYLTLPACSDAHTPFRRNSFSDSLFVHTRARLTRLLMKSCLKRDPFMDPLTLLILCTIPQTGVVVMVMVMVAR